MKLGDLIATITKYTGIKWLVNKIVIDFLGYKSCGCDKRQEKLNKMFPYNNGEDPQQGDTPSQENK